MARTANRQGRVKLFLHLRLDISVAKGASEFFKKLKLYEFWKIRIAKIILNDFMAPLFQRLLDAVERFHRA